MGRIVESMGQAVSIPITGTCYKFGRGPALAPFPTEDCISLHLDAQNISSFENFAKVVESCIENLEREVRNLDAQIEPKANLEVNMGKIVDELNVTLIDISLYRAFEATESRIENLEKELRSLDAQIELKANLDDLPRDKDGNPPDGLKYPDVISRYSPCKRRRIIGIFHHAKGDQIYASWDSGCFGWEEKSEIVFEFRPEPPKDDC